MHCYHLHEKNTELRHFGAENRREFVLWKGWVDSEGSVKLKRYMPIAGNTLFCHNLLVKVKLRPTIACVVLNSANRLVDESPLLS